MFGNRSEIETAYRSCVRPRMALALLGISAAAIACACSSPAVKVTTLGPDPDPAPIPGGHLGCANSTDLTTTATSEPVTSIDAETTVIPAVRSVAGPAETSSPASTVSGTVTDSFGNPMANTIVTGLVSLESSPTDATGHFVLGCHAEPLVASTWELPLLPPHYGAVCCPHRAPSPSIQVPGTPSREAERRGERVDRQLRWRAGRLRHWWGRHGRHPFDSSLLSLLIIDNLYLPGLGEQSSIVIPPISDGHQRISRLAAGVLRIDGAMATLSCSGPGVNNDAPDRRRDGHRRAR